MICVFSRGLVLQRLDVPGIEPVQKLGVHLTFGGKAAGSYKDDFSIQRSWNIEGLVLNLSIFYVTLGNPKICLTPDHIPKYHSHFVKDHWRLNGCQFSGLVGRWNRPCYILLGWLKKDDNDLPTELMQDFDDVSSIGGSVPQPATTGMQAGKEGWLAWWGCLGLPSLGCFEFHLGESL